MKKSRVLCSLFLSQCLVMSLRSEGAKETYCEDSPRPSRVTMRHIEANGIGYNQGYTTLEGFFSPNQPYGSWVPFLDLRGHAFNTGKLAANAGVGLRYLTPSRIWGANAYYDYRNTHHQHYNQVALGFETLGQRWDARINGYLPVGRKTSSLYQLKFSHFAGNSAYLSQKQQIALKGVNAEVGAHVNYKEVPLYFTAGPYYLGAKGKNAWGGQVRAVIDFYEYCRIEGNASYDNRFRWIGQGQGSVIIPFGRRREIKVKNEAFCDQAVALSERAVQRVDRFEIIPVKSRKIRSQAIDPASGEPFFFWFVDNTSSSLGTFESPFNTLLAAQVASVPGQIIYVFPGDGTTKGMNSGITLQQGQTLLGSFASLTLATTKGLATIPPLTKAMPNLANTTGAGDVVTIASNNTVAGLSIVPTIDGGNGVFGNAISNFTAYADAFSTPTNGAATVNGINLLNPRGQILVMDSSFDNFTNNNSSQFGDGIFVQLNTGKSLDALIVRSCAFTKVNQGSSVSAFMNGGTLESLEVSGSSFDSINGNESFGAIGIAMNNNGILMNGNIFDNEFSRLSNGTAILANLNPGTISNLNIAKCSFDNVSESIGVNILNNVGLVSNVNVLNSNFTNLHESIGFLLPGFGSGVTENINFKGCHFADIGDSDACELIVAGTTTLSNVNFIGNTFTGASFLSSSILLNQGSPNGTTMNVWHNQFSDHTGSAEAINIDVSSPFALNAWSNVFTDFTNATALGLFLEGSETLSVDSNQFKGFSGVSNAVQVSAGQAAEMLVTNNIFHGLTGHSSFINVFSRGSGATAIITGNRFSISDLTPADGYATGVTVNMGGTFCLEFIGNRALSPLMPIPYSFLLQSGTFNLTTGSDASTNVGAFMLEGAIGLPGTCSLPMFIK